MNICGLEKRTDLNIKEASLFISYKIIISWLYPLNDFEFILLLCDSAKQCIKTEAYHLQ